MDTPDAQQPMQEQVPQQPITLNPTTPPAESITDVLGIISIVLAFFGLSLIGFILGLVGVSKAKKEGRPTTLSKIGWILNLIFMILFSLLFVFGFVYGFLSANDSTSSDGSGSSISGLTVNRDVYIDACESGAATTASDQISSEQITTYCGCVYDSGVEQYGAEEFTKMNSQIAETNQISPEINELINKCLSTIF